MGIFRGLGVVNDGLVFGYDTGYPITDSGVATRFNQGKPTTNLQVNGVAAGHNSGNYGNVVAVADAPEKGPRWKKVTISNRGSNFRILQWTYTTHDSGVLYSHSAEFDWGNMRDKSYSIVFDGSGGGTRQYFRNRDYSTSGSTSINAALQNGHFASNVTKSGGNHVHAWFIYNYTTGVSGLNDYFYYRDYQVEREPESSPFVSGSRSDTASLIDLKRTTSIDVGDVSFDSNAQPTFDGTDDFLTVPSYSGFTVDTRTVEIIFKMNGSYSNFSPLAVYANGSSSSNRIWLGLQNSQFQMHGWGTVDPSGSTTIAADTWYVCTFSYNKSTQAMKVYTNGVLESSVTNTQGGVTAVSGMNWYLATIPGGWQSVTYSDVDIPSFKIYDRILSDAEVAQNFNAYKNRFNI